MGEENIEELILRKKKSYKEIKIEKSNGTGKRVINCMKKDELYSLQKNLLKGFLSHISIADAACGFVKGGSYYDFLVPHINQSKNIESINRVLSINDTVNKYYLRLDIRDFFGSIGQDLVKENLRDYVVLNDKKECEKLINYITEIATLEKKLPQGGVTSPVLSNIVFRRYDIRIQNYCSKFNVIYTRYADDMLFSSYNSKLNEDFFVKMIKKIILPEFRLNLKKTIITKDEISLNGFVVGENIRISRKKKNRINRIIHTYISGRKAGNIKELSKKMLTIGEHFENKDRILNFLSGYRSFLIGWLPKNPEEQEYKKLSFKISQIEKIIDEIIAMED